MLVWGYSRGTIGGHPLSCTVAVNPLSCIGLGLLYGVRQVLAPFHVLVWGAVGGTIGGHLPACVGVSAL